MSRIYDISISIWPGMPTYPRNPPTSIDPVLRQEAGDATNVSVLSIGTHAGTHVDAPAHLDRQLAGVADVPLDDLVGEALVLDCRGSPGHLDDAFFAGAAIPAAAQRLLLRTRSGRTWDRPGPDYPLDHVGVTSDGAQWLADRGIRLVGIDALSIEPHAAPGRPAHRILLGRGITVLEGVDLRDVTPGRYDLVCLPLRIKGGDGAPARAILLDAGSLARGPVAAQPDAVGSPRSER